jgi:Cu-processing system permease protein
VKLLVWKALARGVVLESIRRKDLWVIAILGLLIMMTAGALGFFGTQGLEVFVKDLAVTVLGMFSAVVAIMTSCRLLNDEIQRRTMYPLLARPITRMDLIVGKLLGAIVVTWISFLLLAGVVALALMSFHVSFEPIMIQYLLAKMLGLAVLCAVTLALSAHMTVSAAATLSFILAFGSTLVIRALVMAYATASPPMQSVFKFLNFVTPQFGLFDLGGRAANIGWPMVPAWVMMALAGYAVLYTTAMLLLSWAKFRNKAL